MWRKVLGAALIALGIFILIPGPDNVLIGAWFSLAFSISLVAGLILSFTVIPAILIVAGKMLITGRIW